MIRCYGVHWHAERVNWGKQGRNHQGTLLGAASKSARAIPVDFREQRGIYALYADYEWYTSARPVREVIGYSSD